MFIRHPDVVMSMIDGQCVIEDNHVRLRFGDESALLGAKVWEHLNKAIDCDNIASRIGYATTNVERVLEILKEELFVLDIRPAEVTMAGEAIKEIRKAGQFWNRHVMAQAFPSLLFTGGAIRHQVLGWGIEFFLFVRAAREYMARGASRIDGSTLVLSELWDHFAEEAFHDEIFRKGLIECGLTAGNIDNRMPLPSTMALLNHLWEASEEGDLQYASVFAVMQPLAEAATAADIEERYAKLTEFYPFALPLFSAFKVHDSIDVALEHSVLTIEPMINERGTISRREMLSIHQTMRRTAENFGIFFAGIQKYYNSELNVIYRQRPHMIMAIENVEDEMTIN